MRKVMFLMILVSVFVVTGYSFAQSYGRSVQNGNTTAHYNNSGQLIGSSVQNGNTTNHTTYNPHTNTVSHGRSVQNGNTTSHYNNSAELIGTSTKNGNSTFYNMKGNN